jgi:hypothetical protein
MIIGRSKAPKATFLGREFLMPLPAPTAQPGSAGAAARSGFDGRLGLRRICERLEQKIEGLGGDVLAQGARGADEKLIAMFREFSSDAEELLGGMAPGPDRKRAAEAARRDGDTLLREAVATVEDAGERRAMAEIAGVRVDLVRRVAAEPGRLAAARRTLEDLADAGELSEALADAVKRHGTEALEAAAGDALDARAVGDTVEKASPVLSQAVSGAGPSGATQPDTRVASSAEIAAGDGAGEPVASLSPGSGVAGPNPVILASAAPGITVDVAELAEMFEAAGRRDRALRLIRQFGARTLGLAFGAAGILLASTEPLNGPVVDREVEAPDGVRIRLRFAPSQSIGRVSTIDAGGQQVEYVFQRTPDTGRFLVFEGVVTDAGGRRRVLSGEELAAAVFDVAEQLRQSGVDLLAGPPPGTDLSPDLPADTSILPARKGKNKKKGRIKTQRGKRRLKGDDAPSGMDPEELEEIIDRSSDATSEEQRRAVQIQKDRGERNKQKRGRQKKKKRR